MVMASICELLSWQLLSGFDLIFRSRCSDDPAHFLARKLAPRAELVSYGNDRIAVTVHDFFGAGLQGPDVNLDRGAKVGIDADGLQRVAVRTEIGQRLAKPSEPRGVRTSSTN
jgi:hypothetical protein